MSAGAELLDEKARPVDEQQGGSDELPVTVIERRPGWRLIDLAELWRYRELLWFLTWRDVKVRYKQTVLGAAWAVLQPLATMAVFTLFLGRLVGASDGAAYPLFVLAGLLPWTFFAAGINSGGQSVVANQNLVTKIYFPRLILPMSAVAAGLVDLAIAFGVLLGMMFWFGVLPGWSMLLVPGIVLLLAVAALGVGTLLSALMVNYRDFRHVVPFLVQLWMFATPAIYVQTDLGLGPTWEALLPLNPAYGLIVAFRQVVFGQPLDLYALGVSSGMGVLLLVVGCLYFRRVERSFADVI
ncbi:MAG: ABC transporter permease [Gemmataceae bacterium]|nr:ABC transporter permease [Gemmataceae bacterium]